MSAPDMIRCVSALRDLQKNDHPWAKAAVEMVRDSLRRTTEAHMFNLSCALADGDLKTAAWVCKEMAKVVFIARALPDVEEADS